MGVEVSNGATDRFAAAVVDADDGAVVGKCQRIGFAGVDHIAGDVEHNAADGNIGGNGDSGSARTIEDRNVAVGPAAAVVVFVEPVRRRGVPNGRTRHGRPEQCCYIPSSLVEIYKDNTEVGAVNRAAVVKITLAPTAELVEIHQHGAQIGAVDLAVAIRVAAPSVKDGDLVVDGVVAPTQRMVGSDGGATDLSSQKARGVACVQQLEDRQRGIGAACVVEDEFAGLDVHAAATQGGRLGVDAQFQRTAMIVVKPV